MPENILNVSISLCSEGLYEQHARFLSGWKTIAMFQMSVSCHCARNAGRSREALLYCPQNAVSCVSGPGVCLIRKCSVSVAR